MSRIAEPLLAITMLAALGGAAQAATLRNMTVLHAPVVRLSDLFDDAGANATRVLGPAPAPGNRIVVEAAQLAAIARQFGADWKPVSPADRAVLERPGRLLPRDDMLAAVKTALVAAGASPDCDITLPAVVSPMIPVETRPHPVAAQLDYDAVSGRFAATLSVTGDGMEPINLRIAGQVDDTVELPVAVARLLPGMVLRAVDLRVARVRAALVHQDVVRSLDAAVGLQVRHTVTAGQPLPSADLTRPTIVVRGATVQIVLEASGITVTARGIAQDGGAAGERIPVMNPSSHAVMEAMVIGPDRVRIVPETIPVTVAAGASRWMQ